MFEIKKGYITNKGIEYPDIINVHYPNRKSTFGNFGTFINETRPEPNSFFSGSQTETEGVYIFKSPYNKNIGLRIYKDWTDSIFSNVSNHERDVYMISELLKIQPKIKLTEFPTGIVTLKNNVIGQVIPLYEKYNTLATKVNTSTKEQIIKYYIDILNILKELVSNEIIYADIHTKNFMINNAVKLIDFDAYNISFNDLLYSKMINNLKCMINSINEYKRIDFILKKENTIKDIEETVLTKSLK